MPYCPSPCCPLSCCFMVHGNVGGEGVSQQMWLMVAAALVVFANVAIWVVPNEKGQSLATGAVDQR